MWSVIQQLGCPSAPLGVAGNVHMHVSPQGHCGYLDFAHALSSSAGVHFLTTGRFCWNYPQMRTVRPPNGFTLADVTKGSALPLRSMEISSQTISFAAHITLLKLDFFFWYRRWVLGWWPSSVAALGSCGLSVPPAARLKWRNVCAILFLQEFKQRDAIWQKNIPIAKTATFFRYLNFCHFFTQKGLALGMLLTFIKMQLHFFKSFQEQIFKSFQMKPILCRSVPPYKRKCV